MKKAVIIGAGQIGRGLAGLVLSRADYSLLFADVNTELTQELSLRGEYNVFTPESGGIETVSGIDAISAFSPRLEYACAEAELICTSVGLGALNSVSRPIAAGLTRKASCEDGGNVNIIACENGVGAGSILKRHVYARLDADARLWCDAHAGFVNCVVDRIIPPMTSGKLSDVSAEDYFEWTAERSGFVGVNDIKIPGLNLTDNLDAHLERKLFTLNGPNAATGALGYLGGYETVREALCDPDIFTVVDGMMRECGQMLMLRHGFSAEECESYRNKLMQRFLSPLVPDKCTRVVREPQRKLSPNDRIVLPMRFALSYGIEPASYYTAVAAMLLYNNPADPQAMEIQQLIDLLGLRRALEEITCISPSSRIASYIEYEYDRLRELYR